MRFAAVLTLAPEGGFIALNPETGTTTQGDDVEEVVESPCEALDLYLEEFPPVAITARCSPPRRRPGLRGDEA